MIYAELGRYPMDIDIKVRIISSLAIFLTITILADKPFDEL
jgi:hypothetical protein